MTNEDREHLNLLSIFHYIFGILTGLLSCIAIVHVVFGLAMTWDGVPQSMARGVGFFGLIFALFGCAFILLGWGLSICLIVAGQRLRQQRSHTFCVVVAAISCTFFPIGTALGVFTLIVLFRPQVKEAFRAETQDAAVGN